MYDLVLAAAGGVLGGYALAWVIHRPTTDAVQNESVRLSCDVCENATFTSAVAARKHALRYHSAIDESNWDGIISEV